MYRGIQLLFLSLTHKENQQTIAEFMDEPYILICEERNGVEYIEYKIVKLEQKLLKQDLKMFCPARYGHSNKVTTLEKLCLHYFF